MKHYLTLSLLILFNTLSTRVESQTNKCDDILKKEIILGENSKLLEKDFNILEGCGYKFNDLPTPLISMALVDVISRLKTPTYGDLAEKVEEIRNSSEYQKVEKNGIGLLVFKVVFFALIFSVLLFWGRIFLKQYLDEDLNEEKPLDQLD